MVYSYEMAYFNFHQDDISEFKAVFKHFDTKNSGYITSEQLGFALRCLEPKPAESDVKRIIRNIEHGNDGIATFQEFLDLLHKVIENGKKKNGHSDQKAKRKRSCYTNLSDDQITDIREAFNMFDRDGDGTISLGELKTVMQSMGQQATDSELKQMLSEVVASKSCTIEFPEFLTMMTRKMSYGDMNNEMFETFRFFDVDGDGTITADEVKKAMSKLGEDITNDEIDEMMKEADLDGDGRVDYTEFAKMVSFPKA